MQVIVLYFGIGFPEFLSFKVFSGFSMGGRGPYHPKYSQNFGMFRLAHQLLRNK